MDPLGYARKEAMKNALRQSGLEKKFDCHLDQKTGKLVISKKKTKNKDKPIDSRFDILDL